MPKVICLDGEHGVRAALTRALHGRFEIFACHDPNEALAQIDNGADFTVAIVALDTTGSDGLAFLEILGERAPTTARMLVTALTFVDLPSLSPTTVFRIVHSGSGDAALRHAVVDAAHYHSLLSRCVMQPVESLRSGPDAEQVSAVTSLVELARPGSGPSWPAAANRVGLRLDDRTVELLPGSTTLGRSRTCHVPIRDPRVSRRHAALTHTAEGLSIRNTSQTSGLWVNGQRLEREQTWPLSVGDRLTLGNSTLEICALGDYNPSLEPTGSSQRETWPPGVGDPPTFAMTAALVEKCAALGRVVEAERILKPTIDGLLRHCRAGGVALNEDIELAVSLSLRLAAEARAGAWIDRVFELFTALASPMPLELVERLQRLIPETRGARMSRFRLYVATLKRREESLTPTERYLMRRVQGLESALMMSAHA